MARAALDPHSVKQAKQRAFRLISTRERSSKELYDRLLKAGFSQDTALETLRLCKGYGYVDDKRFAEAFVRSKISARWGSTRIRRELAKHGIDPDEAISSDELFSEEQEYRRAFEAIARRPTHAKDPYRSLLNRLISKGYPAQVAYRAVNDYLNDRLVGGYD